MPATSGPTGHRTPRMEDSLVRGGLAGVALVALATLVLTAAAALVVWLVTLAL